MSKEIESQKKYGVRRFLNKILHVIAKSSLLSGYARARIHKLRGVNFHNVSTVFIGEDVLIDSIYPSNIFIGDRCIITTGTKIITHFIDTEKLSDHPDYHFRFYVGKVIIENDVFIGMNCLIAKPVTIGRGAIIGANVVITKDVPPGAVMVGASAVNIKQVG